ncbi:hypothetical protein ACK3SF_03290 [Candidatus Nanosalina sp. VS9-1]|uniref:hypothetical protein n=1 Tax=Candidatus Nanosalina sp. VS9-1 TaxID=3388566 RepID=UPI0039E0D572
MTNRKIVFGLVLLTLFMAQGAAQEKTLEPVNFTQFNDTSGNSSSGVELDVLKQVFNDNSDQLPSFAASLIGDQTVRVNMSGIDDEGLLEENSLSFRTSGRNITEIKWGSYNGTTLEISITQENLERLMESEQPVVEASQMLKNGDIEYETYTFTNSIKFGILEFFLGL